MRAGPYSEFGQPDLAGAVRGHVGKPDLAGAVWGHVPLNVPDVTKQSSCIMKRLSRFFVKKNCMS